VNGSPIDSGSAAPTARYFRFWRIEFPPNCLVSDSGLQTPVYEAFWRT
jgi:hypothetical protein